MRNQEHEACWKCENHIYTLVFWSRAYSWKDDSLDPVLEENLVQQIEEENNFFEENPIT